MTGQLLLVGTARYRRCRDYGLATTLRQFGFAASMEGDDIQLQADIVWQGSPAMVDVMSVSGPVIVEEGKGRFVQTETGGALKLLGVFDFASLARRFRLDFRYCEKVSSSTT